MLQVVVTYCRQPVSVYLKYGMTVWALMDAQLQIQAQQAVQTLWHYFLPCMP